VDFLSAALCIVDKPAIGPQLAGDTRPVPRHEGRPDVPEAVGAGSGPYRLGLPDVALIASPPLR
jgi:hypothetical protein